MIRIATYVAFANCILFCTWCASLRLSAAGVGSLILSFAWCFAQVWMFDRMVNVFETTFIMSMVGVGASLLAIYAAALFAERDFFLAFAIVGCSTRLRFEARSRFRSGVG